MAEVQVLVLHKGDERWVVERLDPATGRRTGRRHRLAASVSYAPTGFATARSYVSPGDVIVVDELNLKEE